MNPEIQSFQNSDVGERCLTLRALGYEWWLARVTDLVSASQPIARVVVARRTCTGILLTPVYS